MAKGRRWRPPKYVKILHKWFKITFDPDLTRIADAAGVCGPDTQDVRIDGQLGRDTERETVLHELMHGIWNLTLLDRIYTEDQEEQVIWSLAPLLLTMLRDNPALVEYLLHQDAI
jgi:hypothetical protein